MIRRGAVSALALAVSAATVLVALQTTGPAAAVSPGLQGPLVFVSDSAANGHQDLFTSQADGTGRINLTGENQLYNVYAAAASPDGRTIAYERGGAEQNEIWLMDADGSGKQALTDGSQAASSPTFSPDGARVAFALAGSVVSTDLDGSDLQTISDAGTAPEYSPDGTRVAFNRSDPAAGSRIWVRTLGGAEVALTTYNDTAGRPSWSPDGSLLLFWHDAGDVQGLYTMAPDGDDLQLLAAGGFFAFRSYAWSPSGTRIAYTSNVSGNEEIWVMDADGSNAAQVTDLGASIEHPFVTWSTPPETEPTVLPTLTQGIAMSPLVLPGWTFASYAVTDGALPDGLDLTDTGELSGTPTRWGQYVFEVTTSDPGGETPTTYTMRVLDPEDPRLDLLTPVAHDRGGHAVSLSLQTDVTWLTSDPTSGAVTYDVRLRSARWNRTFTTHQYPATWQGVETTSVRHAPSPGRTYCYSARATDRSGRTGAWSSERCIVAPLDQTSLSTSAGWSTISSSAFYGGSAVRATKKGKTLTRTKARLARVGIVATTCPACGKVAVLVGAKRIGTVDLGRGTRTYHRRTFLLPRFSARKGKVRVKTLTKNRKVIIDAIVIGAT